MIYVVATLTVKPEMRAEFIAGAIACIAETRKEAGNIAYDMHESVTDHAKMVFVEQWENAEALVPHRAAEDRDHYAGQSRHPLIKEKEPGENFMIYVVATSQVKPESRDAFIKGAKECIAATRKEKGCLSYDSHTSINDPNLFVVVERWESREDLNAHGRAPHMKVWREYSAPLKVSPTVIEIVSDGMVETL